MIEMLENPMFQSQMNEAMNNPQVIQMMQNSPMIRDNPMMRNMLNNPEIRRMMMDPTFLRQSMRMSQMMGGGGAGGQPSMPAPGITDTTPQDPSAPSATQSAVAGNNQQPPANTFPMMGLPNAGGAGSNPFAALFGGTNPPGNPSSTADTASNASQPSATANSFGGAFGASGGNSQNPFGGFADQMMQNPDAMRAAMEMFGGGNNPFGGGAQDGGTAGNPFAMFGNGGLGGMGGLGAPPAAPADTRPPEEQYSEQLRQLNDMGFFEFDRNVRALRRSGGSVQGAIEALLSEF